MVRTWRTIGAERRGDKRRMRPGIAYPGATLGLAAGEEVEHDA